MGQNQSAEDTPCVAFTFIKEKCCEKCAKILVEKGCKELVDVCFAFFQLLDISKEELEKFGIEAIHLRKILRSIQTLKDEETGVSSINPEGLVSSIQVPRKAWPYGSDYAFVSLKG
ncbi:hypothetical protein HK096_009895, partial [Nowakowskiella sp. JEL0078]